MYARCLGETRRDAVTVEATMRVPTSDVASLKLRQHIEWMECETIRRAPLEV